MPPMEKIATDSDQYMTTVGWVPVSERSVSSVVLSDRADLSDHTPKDMA